MNENALRKQQNLRKNNIATDKKLTLAEEDDAFLMYVENLN
jgi:hypothetical protein